MACATTISAGSALKGRSSLPSAMVEAFTDYRPDEWKRTDLDGFVVFYAGN